ncbi:MAG: hypothetical protein WCI51_15630 [Lentisphaerota bacterium]
MFQSIVKFMNQFYHSFLPPVLSILFILRIHAYGGQALLNHKTGQSITPEADKPTLPGFCSPLL